MSIINVRKSFSSIDQVNSNQLNSNALNSKALNSNILNSNPSKLELIKNFIVAKKFYFIISSIVLLSAAAVVTGTVVAFNKKNEDNQIENNFEGNKTIEFMEENITIDVNFSESYSLSANNYLKYMSWLEDNNYIACQYNFQNKSFSNKYQHLYKEDTSLIPNNSQIAKNLFYEESYLVHETDEVKYYKEILKKDPPKHYIYGPSYIQEAYNKGEKLYNPNIKLNDTKNWEGITLSLNFKQLPFAGNSNGGRIFGWGKSDWQKPGFYIALRYGVIHYKEGKTVYKYDYHDSLRMGYDEKIPETRYLTYRPLTDERWHQIIISIQKVTKEDEQYLEELSLKEGDYKCELFIDGESRKNTTASPNDNYGELTAFDFGNDEEMKHNMNFYMDNIIVLKKGINISEVKTLFESIDQEAVIVIPDIPNLRCKIPGEKDPENPGEFYPDSVYPLKAETKFFQFTNKWTCLGFSYEDYIKQRLNEFCGEHLKTSDLHYLYGKLQYYQYFNNYKFDSLDVYSYYIPKINEKFKNLETFKKYVKIISNNEEGTDLKNHVISNFGYWISSEGLFQVNKASEEVNGTMRLPMANVNYFAYFEIEGGYINNRIYTILTENSDNITFVYDENKIISYAIKVNQVGYSPSVKNHYGYIGRWMGTLGKLNISEFVGKQFKLMQNGNEVYNGLIKWRTEEDSKYYTEGLECDLNGEQTLLLDISNYEGTGENYYFYVEGIGRSLSFSISYKAVFTAFYTHMKGLYNQRTGIEHKKPYSYWETPAHHKGIYVAHHIPNDHHYSDQYIIDDDTGEGFGDISQFEMIKETRTDEYWEDVFGGHADAGDFDNRPYHLQIIDTLACVFLLRKNYLMDNQLNIPESNDNIPDILNEMEWNLKIHYLIQQKLNNGSVSTWIESTSHPQGLLENGTDNARYYMGLSTREDTLRYAEAAGMLAICFKECQTCPSEKYEKWLNSAKWAFDWAKKEENRCIYSFNFKGKNLTYKEPDVPADILAKAALVLYRLTREEEYKQYIFKDISSTSVKEKYTEGVIKLEDLRVISPITSMPVVLFKDDPDFDLFLKEYNSTAWRHIKLVVDNQNNATQYTYRNAYYYKKEHPYYSSIGWGGFTGGNQLSLMAPCLYLNDGTETGELLLQTISYFYDFSLGCNHYGRTFTTGLGHHYPIHFVNHNNWWLNTKNIFDPIPGITLYTFFGGIEYDAFTKYYRIQHDKYQNTFNGVDMFLIPTFANLTEFPTEYTEIRNHLWQVIPFWRRIVNIEDYSIRSSEYTVYETVVEMALSSGLLLGSDEKTNTCIGIEDCPSLFPNEELKHKSPRDNIKDLLGRWSIP